MKYSYNQFQLRRAEADESGDLGGQGLSDRLEQFIKDNGIADDGSSPPPADPPPVDPPAAKPVEVAAPPPVSPDPSVVADEDEDDDDLPSLGSIKKADAAAAPDFDAQTADIVKAIEAKGHPGDEYKRLRAELKALKESKPAAANLDEIPEVRELKQKASQADTFKAEAEALRQRNRELLQVNNEVEVKESDEYISQVREPLASMEGVVKQIATGAEIEASALFAIIAEPDITKQDRMLEALHQKLGSRTAGRIERFCDDYKAIESRGEALLADAGKTAERVRLAREQQTREDANRRVELFKVSVENSFTSYAKRIPGFTDSSGNLTDVAQATMAKTVEVDLASLGPDDLGYMAFAANALPEARRAIVALQKELALVKGTRPAPKIIDGAPAKPPVADDDYMGLSERMKGQDFVFIPPT